jgi:hypothetical protein
MKFKKQEVEGGHSDADTTRLMYDLSSEVESWLLDKPDCVFPEMHEEAGSQFAYDRLWVLKKVTPVRDGVLRFEYATDDEKEPELRKTLILSFTIEEGKPTNG